MTADDALAAFEVGRVDVDGRTYPYRLLPPPDGAAGPQPLVLFLHGAGERGDDNRAQCTWLPSRLAAPAVRARFPCWLVAPQCPVDEVWVEVPWHEVEPSPLPARAARPLRAALAAFDEVAARVDRDPAREYVTGLSMGGFATWDLVARHPARFAAALAVCGGGDPVTAARLSRLPVEVWHGADDDIVPAARSRGMVDALRAVGAPVRYHELASVGHDSWSAAYGDEAIASGSGLAWLFAQRRPR